MKITSLALFFLVIFNNYVIINYFYVPTLYQELGIGYFISFFIVILISIIVYLILPKSLKYAEFRTLKKNKIFKWTLTTYFILTNVLVLLISSISLAYNFYQNFSPFLFMFFFLLFAVFVIKFPLSKIINSALIFFIIVSLMLCYTDVSHYELLDFSEVLLTRFDPSIFKFIGILIFLSFDNFVFMLVLPMSVKKKSITILIANSVFMLLEIFESLSLVSLFGTSLTNFKGFGYLLYNINPNFVFLENFDFVYVYFVSICCIVKLTFGFKFIEILHFEKKKKLFFIPVILVYGLSYLIKFFWTSLSSYFQAYLCILNLFIIIYFIFLLRLRYGKNKRIN